MAIKDKSVRERQIAGYGEAVAKRYAFLREKGKEGPAIEKDPLLRHLKAEFSRRQRRLLAATRKVQPKPAPVEKPPKKEEPPKKKQKTKKEKAAE